MSDERSRGRWWLKKRNVYVITAVAGLLVLGIATRWIDVVTAPWARSLTGDPLLIGTWKGELPGTGSGTQPMTLRLERVPYKSGRDRGHRIEGMAHLCRSEGGPDGFTISGDTRNWRGTVFRLEASAVKRAPGTYTHLGRLDGEWDGGDTIRLRITPYPVVINADGSATVTSDAKSPYREVTIELRRAEGDESQPLQCPPPPAASTT